MQIEEQIEKEIEKYAEIIGITVEEAKAVFDSVVSDNGLNTEKEEDLLVARSIFRSKFGQTRSRMKQAEDGDGGGSSTEYTGPTYTKKASGFFWGIEQARNWEESRRTNVLAEYQRDEMATLNDGKIVIAVKLEDGRYEITRSVDGEIESKIMEKLHDNKIEVDEDKWIIPIDNRKAFANGQPNKAYGKPTSVEAWSRRLFFIGKVGDSNEYQEYTMTVKDNLAKEFSPNTFQWCEFSCIPNSSNPNLLHGRKDGTTINSLTYVESTDDVIKIIQEVLADRVSSLVALDVFHSDNSHKPSHERIVITDGNVANMNLQRTANGNQTLFLSDLNADFDYEGEGYSSVACWIPEHLEIDFGIGSNVIISGRTSQREVDGELTNVSVNVLGLYVVDRHGSVGDDNQTSEDDFEWF